MPRRQSASKVRKHGGRDDQCLSEPALASAASQMSGSGGGLEGRVWLGRICCQKKRVIEPPKNGIICDDLSTHKWGFKSPKVMVNGLI